MSLYFCIDAVLPARPVARWRDTLIVRTLAHLRSSANLQSRRKVDILTETSARPLLDAPRPARILGVLIQKKTPRISVRRSEFTEHVLPSDSITTMAISWRSWRRTFSRQDIDWRSAHPWNAICYGRSRNIILLWQPFDVRCLTAPSAYIHFNASYLYNTVITVNSIYIYIYLNMIKNSYTALVRI